MSRCHRCRHRRTVFSQGAFWGLLIAALAAYLILQAVKGQL